MEPYAFRCVKSGNGALAHFQTAVSTAVCAVLSSFSAAFFPFLFILQNKQANKHNEQDLGLEYLDLYLIHWPLSFKAGDEMFPKDENGAILYGDEHYTDTWRGVHAYKSLGCLSDAFVDVDACMLIVIRSRVV